MRHIDDIFGEARSLLDGPPDSDTWTRIMSLVDRCSSRISKEVVDFLEPQIARWSIPPQHVCEETPIDEIALAPPSWVHAMANGAASPEFRLVRGVRTQDLALSAKRLKMLLGCDELRNLRSLDFGTTKLTKTTLSTLRTSPVLQNLERIRLSWIDSNNVDSMHGEHTLESLKTLALFWHPPRPDGNSLVRFLSAPAFAHVEELWIGPSNTNFLELFDGENVLRELRVVGFDRQNITLPYSRRPEGIMRHVERVCLRHRFRLMEYEHYMHGMTLPEFFTFELDRLVSDAVGILHLDVSGVRAGPGILRHEPTTSRKTRMRHDDPELLSRYMGEAILNLKRLPMSVNELTLGPWWTEELAERLLDERGIRAYR